MGIITRPKKVFGWGIAVLIMFLLSALSLIFYSVFVVVSGAI